MVDRHSFDVLRVQVKSPLGSKTQIWHTEQPLKLANPFALEARWQSDGVEVWDQATQTFKKATSVSSPSDVCPAAVFAIDHHTSVEFSPLRFATAPYDAISDGNFEARDSLLVMGFSGFSSELIEDKKFKKQFQATQNGIKVFRLKRQGVDWEIQVQSGSVSFISQTGQIHSLAAGGSIPISAAELFSGYFQDQSGYWWRFRGFQKKFTANLLLESDVPSALEAKESARVTRALLLGTCLSLGLFSTLFYFKPTPEGTEKKLAESDGVEIKLERPKPKEALTEEQVEAPKLAAKPVEPPVATPTPEPTLEAKPEAVAKVKEPEPIEPKKALAVKSAAPSNQARITPKAAIKAPAVASARVATVSPPPSALVATTVIKRNPEISKLQKVIEDPSARLLAQNQENLKAAFGDLIAKPADLKVAQSRAARLQEVSNHSHTRAPASAEVLVTTGEAELYPVAAAVPVEDEPPVKDLKLSAITQKSEAVRQTQLKQDLKEHVQTKSFIALNKEDVSLDDSSGGVISRDAVEAVIRSQLNRIRSCHETALMDHDDLAGVVNVEFVVGLDGSVKSSKIKNSTVNDKTLEKCLLRSVGMWRFPKPQGNKVVTVSYPFTFRTLAGGDT